MGGRNSFLSVPVEGCIKHPFAPGFVGQIDEKPVFCNERSFLKPSVDGLFHIQPFVRHPDIDAFDDLIFHLHLQCIRKGFSIQVVERNLRGGFVQIHNDLIDKVCAVGIQRHSSAPVVQPETVVPAHSVVPGNLWSQALFLNRDSIQMIKNIGIGSLAGTSCWKIEIPVACHEGRIFSQNIGHTSSLSGRKAKNGFLRQIVFEVKPWREPVSEYGMMIGPQSSHSGKSHSWRPCEFSKATRNLFDSGKTKLVALRTFPFQRFCILVPSEAYTHPEFQIRTADDGLINKVGIYSILRAVVSGGTKFLTGLVASKRGHQTNALVFFPGKNVADFTKALPLLVVNCNHIWVVGIGISMMKILSSGSLILQKLNSELGRHALSVVESPSLQCIDLLSGREIKEIVVVVIHFVLKQVAMNKVRHKPFAAQLLCGVDVGFEPAHRIAVHIDKQLFPCSRIPVRFFQFYVDLPGHRLVAIGDRAHAFGYLNRLYPGTGRKSHPEIRHQSTHARHVFLRHLRVVARKPQHLNLFGAGHCIAIIHFHGRIGFEAFAQVAAGCLHQFLARHHGGADGFHAHVAGRNPTFHGNFLQLFAFL